MAEFRFAHDNAGEEGAERERHPEQVGRAVGDAQRDGVDRQPEQLAAAGSLGATSCTRRSSSHTRTATFVLTPHRIKLLTELVTSRRK